MKYKGVIIEESLTNSSIIEELNIIQKEVENITEKEGTPWLDKWTMYTVEIDSKDIDNICKRLSKLIDEKHCSDWYCDFKNSDFHYVVFSNKVFKLNRKSKKDYLDMQEYAKKVGLMEAQLPRFSGLPINLLKGFLIDAKKETYANSNALKSEPSRMGSKDYHFEYETEGCLMSYHDTFFGGTNFIGEEIVYLDNAAKWGMNYYGKTLNESLSESAIDEVLRPALMKVGEDSSILPVRGPSRFENDEWLYTFKSNGTLEDFSGVEEIYKDGELVYQLNCTGGIIE